MTWKPAIAFISLVLCITMRPAESKTPVNQDAKWEFIVHNPECISQLRVADSECAKSLPNYLKSKRVHIFFDLPTGWNGLTTNPLPYDSGKRYIAILNSDRLTISLLDYHGTIDGISSVYGGFVKACIASRDNRCKYGLTRAAAAAALWTSYTTSPAVGVVPLTMAERQTLADSFSRLEVAEKTDSDDPIADHISDGVKDIIGDKFEQAAGISDTLSRAIIEPIRIIGTPVSSGELPEYHGLTPAK